MKISGEILKAFIKSKHLTIKGAADKMKISRQALTRQTTLDSLTKNFIAKVNTAFKDDLEEFAKSNYKGDINTRLDAIEKRNEEIDKRNEEIRADIAFVKATVQSLMKQKG